MQNVQVGLLLFHITPFYRQETRMTPVVYESGTLDPGYEVVVKREEVELILKGHGWVYFVEILNPKGLAGKYLRVETLPGMERIVLGPEAK